MKEWLRAEEIAAERLPGLPSSKRGVNAVADRLGWRYTEQCRLAPGGRGGGREYRYSLFSPEAQAAYLASHINDQDTQQENRPSVSAKITRLFGPGSSAKMNVCGRKEGDASQRLSGWTI